MGLNFLMPAHLVVGENSVRKNSALIAKYGKKCLIVTGKNSAKASGALDDVIAALTEQNIAYEIFDEVEQNPTTKTCTKGATRAKEIAADFIIGIGGGSPLDAAKAIAVYAASDVTVEEAFTGKYTSALPIVLVGTTSGTGSEVTQWAVLIQDNGRKRTVAGQKCYASLSFGDPRYTQSLSYKFTISTALDALSHASEGYFSAKADAISDTFALKAIKIIYDTLRDIEDKPVEEITASQRQDLYMASIYAGITLNTCGSGFPHPMGYFLTETRGVSHGTACGVFLPSYLFRACKYESKKAVALFEYLDSSAGELTDFIERFTNYTPDPITQEEMDDMLTRWKSAANFDRAPGGRDDEYTKQTLKDIYKI